MSTVVVFKTCLFSVGAIFGPTIGTMIACGSGTLAATIAFLISRYFAREKVCMFHQRGLESSTSGYLEFGTPGVILPGGHP